MEKTKRSISAVVILTLLLSVCAVPVISGDVAYAAAKMKLSKKKATLTVGKTLTLKVKNKKKKAKVKWTSSKKSVASVSKKGKVKAKKAGKATITAKVGKKKLKCKITVKAKPVTAPKPKPVDPLLNPSGVWIIEKLKTVSYIDEIEAVTEATDDNKMLNKPGGYTSCTYFTSYLVDQDDVIGDTPIEKGTDGGGCIEVFKTATDANKRNAYLATFDGTILDSGSHKVYGSIIIRTSSELTATQQILLESAIYQAFLK